MKIVLLAGYAGSGKDTVGALFTKAGYKRVAFADRVKTHSAEIHGFPFELTQTQEGKSTVVKSKSSKLEAPVRWFLIDESRRMKEVSNDPAYWARAVSTDIRTLNQNIVITDWRYKAEYNLIKEQFPNATIMRVRVLRNVVVSDDPSEHEIDHEHYDCVLRNYGTLDDLRAEIQTYFPELESEKIEYELRFPQKPRKTNQ